MNTISTPTLRRRLALAGAVVAIFAVGLGNIAPASAATSAEVKDDTLIIKGDDVADTIVVRPAAGSTAVEVDFGGDGTVDGSFDTDLFSQIVVKAGGGDDHITIENGIVGKAITIEGGDGDDVIIGSNAVETAFGGPGNDLIDLNAGNDVAFLGLGNDTFQWDPGDGSDVVEGGRGHDTMLFFGSNAGETMDLSANGARSRFFRNIGNIVMDMDDIERLDLMALGGSDVITVSDMSGTGMRFADIDLTNVTGDGDEAADEVIVTGTDDVDDIAVSSADDRVVVGGLATEVRVLGAESDADQVTIDGLGGSDTIIGRIGVAGPAAINARGGAGDVAVFEGTDERDVIEVLPGPTGGLRVQAPGTAPFDAFTPELVVRAGHGDDDVAVTGNTAPLAEIQIDGGSGDDRLIGSNGAEVFLAGPGDDFVDGNQGADLVFLGGGDDVFQWDPGDGSDIVEGGRGSDTMTFFGSNASEIMHLSANGPRARFFRNIGNIVMDLNGVERLDLVALGGADIVTVNDMSGTDLTVADIDLGVAGAGDTAADQVIVNATNGDDRVKVEAIEGDVLVRGLAARTRIFDAEPTLDTLRINALAGFDVVTIADAVAALIQASVDLGTQ